MKKLKFVAGILLAMAVISVSAAARADGTNTVGSTNSTNSASDTPPKPDLLTTCPVSGDKLGDMGKPYVFVYKGQEVKLCCPDCKADFDKNPAKYMKMIRAADKTAKK
jgi:YHS domain-containing protein